MSLIGKVLAAVKGTGEAAPPTQVASITPTPSIATTATERADILRIIDGVLGPKRHGNEYVFPTMSYKLETIAAVARRAGKPFADSKELAELRKLQAQYMSGLEALHKWSPEAARVRWTNEQVVLAEKIISGGTIDDDDGWSRENWEHDYATKREAGRHVMNKASAAANAVLQLIGKRVVNIIKATEQELLLEEWKRHQEFAIPFEPTPLNRAFWGLSTYMARILNQWAANGSCGQPAEACEMIGIPIDPARLVDSHIVSDKPND